ncbi:Crp/Fnr family transcriptional regulator [Azospirillum canadense]|uniref:Crp/Fnr family transcriptional regulator n=1 Tax=Azospirillum canadense TaxID=403962 RepID=UPI002226DAC1|nr:Crp/Fnr family transcriptional regulator [Azospirillum canadense]MCW2239132.1 CRP-like cAMP-binding protein [Azospirillum canadense]
MESRNFILSSLSSAEEALIRPHLEPASLPHKMTFYRADEPITMVWFIERGCASVINVLPDGDAVEVGTIGNEGLVGTPVLLEADRIPCQCDMQIPGDGWRMSAQALRTALRRSDTLRTKLLRFAQAHFNQVAQTAACNSLHSIEERCARWLSMSRDRAGDDFPLTHEYLAIMLGVRRSGVTVTANLLQNAGLIRHTRGHITITDPVGLEEAACDCYRIVRDEFRRLLPLGNAYPNAPSKR